MRQIISDFAVFITIVTMVGTDYALGVPSPKLQVPNEFKVSSPQTKDKMAAVFSLSNLFFNVLQLSGFYVCI